MQSRRYLHAVVVLRLVLWQPLTCCARTLSLDSSSGRRRQDPAAPVCAADDQLQGATDIHDAWLQRAGGCLKQIEAKACTASSPQWLMDSRRLCAYKFTYSNGTFTYDKSAHATCDANSPLQQRPGILAVLLNYLVRWSNWSDAQLPDFSFYFFTRDGQPADNPLRCYLGLPAVVAGLSYSDTCSFPVPHPHYLLAMISHYGLDSALAEDLGTEDLRNAGAYLLTRYAYGQAHPAVPWHKRSSKLGYRGSCTLTHDPDDSSVGKWIYVRPQMCNITASAGLPAKFVDVGIAMNDPAPDWQDPCRACQKPSLSAEQWMPSRYHLLAEGYGTSSEATDMKFMSGGVVIWPTFEGYDDHLYYQWYQPLLKPGINYFRPTIGEVVPLVLSCEKHLQKQCMQVAQSGHQMYACKVTMESAGMYMLKVMETFSKWKRTN